MNPNIVWAVILGSGAAYEAYALLDKAKGDTLSERTRAWFRTHTKPGRASFIAAWVGFAVWFLLHITLGGKQ